jgi:hypothetical protein
VSKLLGHTVYGLFMHMRLASLVWPAVAADFLVWQLRMLLGALLTQCCCKLYHTYDMNCEKHKTAGCSVTAGVAFLASTCTCNLAPCPATAFATVGTRCADHCAVLTKLGFNPNPDDV